MKYYRFLLVVGVGCPTESDLRIQKQLMVADADVFGQANEKENQEHSSMIVKIYPPSEGVGWTFQIHTRSSHWFCGLDYSANWWLKNVFISMRSQRLEVLSTTSVENGKLPSGQGGTF